MGDTIEPTSEHTVQYSEGLAQGYRSKNAVAFPFGHGLTYTNFSFSNARYSACDQGWCVMVDVRNTGGISAATVAQLYLLFPSEAQQPSHILKGFSKTSVMAPNGSQTITFRLAKRDISYWNGSWKQVSTAVAHI